MTEVEAEIEDMVPLDHHQIVLILKPGVVVDRGTGTMASDRGQPTDGEGWKPSIANELRNALDSILRGILKRPIGPCRKAVLVVIANVIHFQGRRKDVSVMQRSLIARGGCRPGSRDLLRWLPRMAGQMSVK